MSRNLLSGIHNPRTSQWASSSLLVRIITKQEPIYISNIFQGNLVPGILQDTLFNFERRAVNTIQLPLPNEKITDCFFDLSSNTWKHAQSAGLYNRYKEDPEFALHLRMLAALTFVP